MPMPTGSAHTRIPIHTQTHTLTASAHQPRPPRISNFFTDGETLRTKPWFFTWTFALSCVTIASGCLAERTHLFVYPVYTAVLSLLVHPVVAHWVWNPESWLNAKAGTTCRFLDFAGGTVVHIVGKWWRRSSMGVWAGAGAAERNCEVWIRPAGAALTGDGKAAPSTHYGVHVLPASPRWSYIPRRAPCSPAVATHPPDSRTPLTFLAHLLRKPPGGLTGLIGAIAVGPRMGRFEDGVGKEIPGHDVSSVSLGTFMLWFGW